MTEIANQLRNALIQMRDASLAIVDEKSYKETTKKYDCVLLGEKFNKLGSYELLHSLKKNFDVEMTNEELLEYLPTVCKTLDMQLEGLQRVDKLGEISAYFIELH